MSIRTTGKFLEGSGLGLDRCIDNFFGITFKRKKDTKNHNSYNKKINNNLCVINNNWISTQKKTIKM